MCLPNKTYVIIKPSFVLILTDVQIKTSFVLACRPFRRVFHIFDPLWIILGSSNVCNDLHRKKYIKKTIAVVSKTYVCIFIVTRQESFKQNN